MNSDNDTVASPHLLNIQLDLEVLKPIHFKEFAGSALRGLWGKALRELLCTTELSSCTHCPIKQHCRYPIIFEPVTADAQLGMNLPRPWVLHCAHLKPDYLQGEIILLKMTLIGDAIGDFSNIVNAWKLAEQYSLDVLGKFTVKKVTKQLFIAHEQSEYKNLLARNSHSVALHFVSPLCLKKHGRTLLADQFDAKQFLTLLALRVDRLNATYDSTNMPLSSWSERVKNVELTLESSELEWQSWQRISTRQHKRLQLNGVVGRVVISSSSLEHLLPLLFIGQWLHVGKHCGFGLGEYRMVEP